jgi:integral membrane sensor domain MASE1
MGGYRHVQFLSKDEITGALEVNFFLRAANILSFASGKAAVGSLILRLMGRFNQWQRWVVWVVIVLTAIINILNCIFNFVQCRPIKANWNPEVPHSCWPPQAQLDFAYFMSSVSHDLICPYMHVSFLSFLFADFGE